MNSLTKFPGANQKLRRSDTNADIIFSFNTSVGAREQLLAKKQERDSAFDECFFFSAADHLLAVLLISQCNAVSLTASW